MDYLSRLPANLRQRVFCHLNSRQDVASLSSTSRLLFDQAKASKLPITRQLLWYEIPEHLLQDAIAIITFPESRTISKHDAGLEQELHLDVWACKQLPNPLLSSNSSLIFALDSPYRTMVSYINDYLTKALS
jgi:hypothetical protein